MRKFGLLLVSVTGLMVCSAGAMASIATSADSAPTATDATQASATADPNKMVCKTMPPPTGTRLGSRHECHTQAEWDERMREDQKKTSQIQNAGYQDHIPH